MPKEVNLDGVTFAARHPLDIGEGAWRSIQQFERDVFAEAMDGFRSAAEVDAFVQWNNPEGFRESRVDPQVAVREGHLNPGRFARPVVATARDAASGDLIGYAWLGDNTSPPLARLKMWTPPGLDVPKVGGKRYAWGREFVVHPDYQDRGVGQMLGLIALETRHREQAVAVYTIDEMRMAAGLLERLGFHEARNPKARRLFGSDRDPTTISRWSGPAVGTLVDQILQKPGMSRASVRVYTELAYPPSPQS